MNNLTAEVLAKVSLRFVDTSMSRRQHGCSEYGQSEAAMPYLTYVAETKHPAQSLRLLVSVAYLVEINVFRIPLSD